MELRSGGQREKVRKLADELFSEIQRSQGYFYVSDGEEFATTEKFFERIRGRLAHGKIAVKIMERFLRKHRQLNCKIAPGKEKGESHE